MRTPRLTDGLSIDLPFSQWLTCKRLLSSPGHVERPTLVTDPVTDPVVCSDVDQCADATLEEFRNVGICRMVFVLSVVKCIPNRITAGAKV